MKRVETALLLIMLLSPLAAIAQTEKDISSPTEGVITSDYLGEPQLMDDALVMLADFMEYAKSIFQSNYSTNAKGAACGYFKANSAGQNNEDGVRTNADIAMLCAFVYKYCQAEGVDLPNGISYNDVLDMALQAIRYSYSTHTSNQLLKTTNNSYWGTSTESRYVWESSLWTESIGFATWMLNDQLTDADKSHIKNMIMAEADYELTRTVPTGYKGDTKAEENGWETNVLAVACALYPEESNAQAWYSKMQSFASNCYSMLKDATDGTMVDGIPASSRYIGQNLYNDYTLQNHNYFHTSYQNVVIQELCESYLALQCIQGDDKKFPLSESLLWNCQKVFDQVLKELALADGELAMPTGNDWSMYLYDQLPTFTGMATIMNDKDALMLENLAFKYTKARQKTTNDGSWMLNSDIGPRRMGVTGHRVMMTYLMHKFFPVGKMRPTEWDEFLSKHKATKYFDDQNLIRSMSNDRFTCFYWNDGLRKYSGTIVPNSVDKNKIMVPFVTHNTGNFLGNYSKSDNTASIKGHYAMYPEGWAMNGKVLANGGQIPNPFCIYATSGNAVILIDALKANAAATVSSEQGGMMGISVDPFTKEKRTIYYDDNGSITSLQTDGSKYSTWNGTWANIDNQVGFISKKAGNTMAFGDKNLEKSIYTAKIYPSYSGSPSSVGTTMNHIRNFVYYSNVTAEETQALEKEVQDLTQLDSWTEGWHGVIAPDPDGTNYMLLSNMFAEDNDPWTIKVTCKLGAPVFTQATDINDKYASSTFYCAQNFNIANELRVFINGAKLQAVQADENPYAAYLHNDGTSKETAVVRIVNNGKVMKKRVTIKAGKTIRVDGSGTSIKTEEVTAFPGDYRNVAYGKQAYSSSYDGEHLPFSVIDNREDTYFKTLNNGSDDEFIAFRLRNNYSINKIVVTPFEGQPFPTTVAAQYSDADGSYADIPDAIATTDNGRISITFPSTDARFVKLRLKGDNTQFAIKKVAIYGVPKP